MVCKRKCGLAAGSPALQPAEHLLELEAEELRATMSHGCGLRSTPQQSRRPSQGQDGKRNQIKHRRSLPA